MTEIDPVAVLSGLVSFVAIIITLVTAINSAKSTSLNDLLKVVEALKTRLDEQHKEITGLKNDLDKERSIRMAYEDYIRSLMDYIGALAFQLKTANLEPKDIKAFVKMEHPARVKTEPIRADANK